jgi:hypothetical protein
VVAAEGERPGLAIAGRAESLRHKDRGPEGVLESPVTARPAPTG